MTKLFQAYLFPYWLLIEILNKKASLNDQQGSSGFYKTYYYELFLEFFYFFLSSYIYQLIHFHGDWRGNKYGRICSDKDTE